MLLCYRISATEPPWEASRLDLIFIRIACLYCHIPSPSHTLWWTQFSAGVATTLTAWFFTLQQSRTGWPVISAFTIPDPLWLTCSKRTFFFFLWPTATLHCHTDIHHLENYSEFRRLSKFKGDSFHTWDGHKYIHDQIMQCDTAETSCSSTEQLV